MRLPVSNPAGIEPRAWLFDCIQQLAARASNPVLEVLHGVTQVEQEHKYPEPGLTFAGNSVGAFYHCHAVASRPANEHGHFHLFLHCGGDREKLQNWAHLTGLSMDRLGQPLRWFTVNRWVSAGPWRTAPELVRLMERNVSTQGLQLVEAWLLAMLAVYQRELVQLINARDQTLIQLTTTADDQAVLEDRRYYEFSACAIDLLTKFQEDE
jgi:hypothetical protein